MKLSPGFSIRFAVGLWAVLAAVTLDAEAASQERKISVSPSELPPAIKAAIEKAFPNGRIIQIEKEVEGDDVGQFDFEILSSGKQYEVEVSKEAKIIETIVGNNVTLKTPAGTFKNCLLVEETSGLDPNEKYFKTYAPGIGLIQDEDLFLTGYKTVQP